MEMMPQRESGHAMTGAEFYITGGTLRYDAPCYVERQADKDLYASLQQGEFCYLLTSRQMGKSSLMTRTAVRLRAQGVAVSVLDLTSIGQNLTPEQWYGGLLGKLGEDLGLEDELEEYWLKATHLGPLQRWMEALHDIVLPHVKGRLVIFIDEVDAVRSLPFSTDEFFAAIRGCYNRRSEDARYLRVTFCLLGVATPSDLIRDNRTTPFNIGRRIELRDFTAEEAVPLQQGLQGNGPRAQALLARVLYWTGGHPYLTQRLCQTVAADPTAVRPKDVDRLCSDLFLSHRARERDDNLLFVRERLLRSEADIPALLEMYRKARAHGVPDDETNQLIPILRLSGIVRVEQGQLRVRNAIYRQVFDAAWITAHMPDAELRRQRIAYRNGVLRTGSIAAVVIAALLVTTLIAISQAGRARAAEAKARVAETKALDLAEARQRLLNERERMLQQLEEEAQTERKLTRQAQLSRAKADRSAHAEQTARQAEHTLRVKIEQDRNQVLQRQRDYYDTHIEYYSGVLNPKGDVQGLCRIPEEWVAHRSWSLKYYRRGRKGVIYRIEAVNGNGLLTPLHCLYTDIDNNSTSTATRECRWEYERGTDGQLINEKGFDQNGRLVYNFHYTSSDTGYYLDAYGYPRARTGSGAAYVRYSWSAEGLRIQRRFTDRAGNPQPDSTGSYGMEFEYNHQKLPVKVINLGADGKPTIAQNYATSFVLTYDQWGNRSSITYLDGQKKPCLVAEGIATIRYAYDRYGNNTQEAYFDTKGKPIQCKNGYAKVLYSFDDHGFLTRWEFYGTNGKRVVTMDGYAMYTCTYDQNGNRTEWAYFGLDGKPVFNREGVARETMRYDEQGNIVEWAEYGTDGTPVNNKSGYSRQVAQYDAQGRVTSRAYFDHLGRPTPETTDGMGRVTYAYDERGNIVEWRYFDSDGKPVLINDGYSRITVKYDDRGNQTALTYFGTDDKPILMKDGYARREVKYNDRGNEREWDHFGVDGKRILCNEGYSWQWTKENERGLIASRIYSDTEYKKSLNAQGYAEEDIAYDAQGNITDLRYFGTEYGKPVLCNDGYAHERRKYDARGNVTHYLEYGIDDKPVLNSDGYAAQVIQYDENDRIKARSYYGTDGKLMLRPEGYARIQYTYDDRGNVTREAYFGIEGKLVNSKYGYAYCHQRFDARDNLIAWAGFSADGKPVAGEGGFAKKCVEYDAFDRISKESLYGPDGELLLLPDSGHAMMTCTYDARGRRIEEAYFDRDGMPIACKKGFARLRMCYDDHGRISEYNYFDTDGKPALHSDGNTRYTQAYDDRGNLIEIAYYGLDGKLVMAKCGFARRTYAFDDRKRLTELVYYDAENNLLNDSDGYAKVVFTYDGLAGMYTRERYDYRNLHVETAYLDADDELRLGPEGYARVTFKYNDKGTLTEWICLDTQGAIVFTPAMGAKATIIRNAEGDQIGYIFYTENGLKLASEIVVREIFDDGQAKKVGLLANDRIVSYNGKHPEHFGEFLELTQQPGEGKRELTVRRKGMRLTFQVDPGKLGIGIDEVVAEEAVERLRKAREATATE